MQVACTQPVANLNFEELLRRADLLLDETALRDLVSRFESRLASALLSPTEGAGLPHEVFKFSGALSLLAEALRDPDVKVRAMLSCSPEPNALQQKDFAEAYLRVDRPTDALAWLKGQWGHMEDSRQSLLAKSCVASADTKSARSRPMRTKTTELRSDLSGGSFVSMSRPEGSRRESSAHRAAA